MMGAIWTTRQDIRAYAQRCWDDGRVLAARLGGAPLFPLAMRLKGPSTAAMGEQFDAVRLWIRELEAGSRPQDGHGYSLVWRDINHRQLGRNRLPEAAVFERQDDLLRWLGLHASALRFDALSSETMAAFPELGGWIARYPLLLLEQGADWPRVLAVLSWFRTHPRPHLYLRQLDIPGADTKFMEKRKGLLTELLDIVLAPEHIDPNASGARQFEARFHLLNKPVQVRFRLLDQSIHIAGMSDICIPVAQFAALRLPVQTVFITENEINGLSFPDYPQAMVVFGGGYGVDRLGRVEWLRSVRVVYWGDLDTHGFAILDRLRASLPHVESMMMDVATLEAHRALWGQEPAAARFLGDLARLTDAERAVFDLLRHDRIEPAVRLEQERIGFGWVRSVLQGVLESAQP